MFSEIRINKQWIVNKCSLSSTEVFNGSQLNQLRGIFDEESVSVVDTFLLKQIQSLGDGGVFQVEIPPFYFIVMKNEQSFMTALSNNEKAPDIVQESNLSSMETSFIAHSPKMKDLMDIVKKVSFVDSTILLLGTSGVGKSVIAKLIHKYSSRSGNNFISVNCGAIPESLMEAELFGYTHGSFTGGQRGGKKGIFEAANGGTIFLDEIGELPHNLQVKLLEVLQENSIRPIGSTQLIPVNVRVIAATNQNLLELVQQKKFRIDLYYRLNVVPIEIPSIRDRKEDILPLAKHFLNMQVKKHGIFKSFHPDVYKIFLFYDWPGNVRELANIVERLFITTNEREIQVKHLPTFLKQFEDRQQRSVTVEEILPLKEAKRMVEEELIQKAYDLYKSTYKAAKVLHVDQSTVAKKLKELRMRERN